MRIVKLEIDNAFDGVDAISLVQFPAIELNFQVFSKSKKRQEFAKAVVNEDKRLVVGPALLPDKMIYRSDDSGEYYVYFDQATVRKAAYSFLKANKQHMATVEHEVSVPDVTVVESWVVEGKHDKALHLGYDVPPGTWMVAMQVNNDDVWALAKEGVVKGFSIEGWFAEALSASQAFRKASNDELLGYLKKMLKDDPTRAEMVGWDVQWAIQSTIADRIKEDADFMVAVQKVVSKVKAPEPGDARVKQKNFNMKFLDRIRQSLSDQKKFATATLEDGTTITTDSEDAMAVGQNVYVVSDDGNLPVPDGEYTLSDGAVLVASGGVIESLTPGEEAAAEDVDMAAAITAAVQAAIAPLVERLDKLEASRQEHEEAITEVATSMRAVAKAPAGEPIKKRIAASTEPKATEFKPGLDIKSNVRQIVENSK